ncbi:MAG TPA: glycosyltransferase family 39 protein [Spirochaetota bacterium]|nr:glycosyltransferase family 39 protein [Spirochaetota bacterium]HPR49574.1 glycosyltransferase family 39 protein [Spirochaetota bacterium]
MKPITAVLVFNAAVFLVGITWGLPNNETWLSDSMAPYHPLLGLSQGFSFGYLNKYPLVHQFILAVLNLPVLIVAIVNSHPLEGLQFLKFVTLIRSPDYATFLILIDRLVSVFMGLGIVYYLYRSAKELFNERAGLITAGILSFNAVFNFFSHVAKVEVPYMFWAVLALYKLIHAVKYSKTRDFVYVALFSCLSYGTKDQAYSIFVIPFIVYLFIYPVITRERGRPVLSSMFNKNTLVFIVSFIGFSLIAQNIVLNWEGFLYRFSLLIGSSREGGMHYEFSLIGLAAMLGGNLYSFIYSALGPPMALTVLGGTAYFVIARRNRGREYAVQLIFLLASLSYFICFMLIILQSTARFVLPQSVFLAVYGGFFVDRAIDSLRGRWKPVMACLAALAVVYSLYNTLSVNVEMLTDLRYSVEDWMKQNIPENSVIEYYAYLHYLPRFPDGTRSYRVKKDVSDIEKRKPDYIVITSHYYGRYQGTTDYVVVAGRIINSSKNIRRRQSDFPEFYQQLFTNTLPHYRRCKSFYRWEPWYREVSYARISPERITIFRRESSAR